MATYRMSPSVLTGAHRVAERVVKDNFGSGVIQNVSVCEAPHYLEQEGGGDNVDFLHVTFLHADGRRLSKGFLVPAGASKAPDNLYDSLHVCLQNTLAASSPSHL